MLRRVYVDYRELILYRAYSDLRQESERTYAGYLWWIIEPLAQLVVYYLVFGLLLRRRGPDFVALLVVGIVTWRWMQTATMSGADAISGGRALMQRVYLPKIVFPTVAILTTTFKFLVTFLLVLVFLWLSGYGVSAAYVVLPCLFVIELSFIAAVTYISAAVVPFLPDLRIVLDNALRLLFFLSGVFYPGSALPEGFRPYFYLNPMATLIDAYRDVLLHGQWPPAWPLVAVGLFSSAGVLAGSYLLARYDYVYPKLGQ